MVTSIFSSSSPPSAVETDSERAHDFAATLSSIFIYPIKSCRGISVSEAVVTPTGFLWDRNWAVVNSKGRAYTQRVEPRLALVSIQFSSHHVYSEQQHGMPLPTKESYLVLNAPEMDTLKVSLNQTGQVVDDVSVWEWSGSAYDQGLEASNWFTDFLGKPSRLVRFKHDSEVRLADPNYAMEQKIAFSDVVPFMLASQESLNELNTHLEESVPINRFRPNFLVEGCAAFCEDLWKRIEIGKLRFQIVQLCARCKMPAIDQETGLMGSEPTEILKKIRSAKSLRIAKTPDQKVFFGQNMVCQDPSSTTESKVVRVGDPIYVHEKFSSIVDVPI